jgi:hypothetical protein
MLFIYSVYLSLLLLKHYWSFTLTLAHCDLYKTFALCFRFYFTYIIVANTLVNTDVTSSRRIILVFLAAVATLTALHVRQLLHFQQKQFCTLFE